MGPERRRAERGDAYPQSFAGWLDAAISDALRREVPREGPRDYAEANASSPRERAAMLLDVLVERGAIVPGPNFDADACAGLLEPVYGDADRFHAALLDIPEIEEVFLSEDDIDVLFTEDVLGERVGDSNAVRKVSGPELARADETLKRLRQIRFDNSRDAEMVALTSVDLLILDDFALEPMTKEESQDVYQLFLERTGRGSSSSRPTATPPSGSRCSTMSCSRRAPSIASAIPPTTSLSTVSPMVPRKAPAPGGPRDAQSLV